MRAHIVQMALPLVAPVAREIQAAREVRTRHRRTDGGGSRQAAERVVRSGQMARQHREVLDALRRHPGLTSRELADRTGLDRHMLGRRLPELAAAGSARREQPGGEREWRWWAMPEAA